MSEKTAGTPLQTDEWLKIANRLDEASTIIKDVLDHGGNRGQMAKALGLPYERASHNTLHQLLFRLGLNKQKAKALVMDQLTPVECLVYQLVKPTLNTPLLLDEEQEQLVIKQLKHFLKPSDFNLIDLVYGFNEPPKTVLAVSEMLNISRQAVGSKLQRIYRQLTLQFASLVTDNPCKSVDLILDILPQESEPLYYQKVALVALLKDLGQVTPLIDESIALKEEIKRLKALSSIDFGNDLLSKNVFDYLREHNASTRLLSSVYKYSQRFLENDAPITKTVDLLRIDKDRFAKLQNVGKSTVKELNYHIDQIKQFVND